MRDGLADTLRQLTKAQRQAFERIAINLDIGVSRRTAAILLEQGLIEETQETLPSWPTSVTVTRYYVPLPIHMEWCRLAGQAAKRRRQKMGGTYA